MIDEAEFQEMFIESFEGSCYEPWSGFSKKEFERIMSTGTIAWICVKEAIKKEKVSMNNEPKSNC
jgi:hypothetical protein